MKAHASRLMKHTHMANSVSCTYTYKDCLKGTVPGPSDAVDNLVFQALMVVGMVSIMATFNGVSHSGVQFFITHHWLYPLVATIAFLVRIMYANPIFTYVSKRFIWGRFRGVASNVLTTLLNVVLMAPAMAALTTLLLYGTQDYVMHIATTLPISFIVALFVSYFIVGPAAKLIFHNVLLNGRGSRLLQWMESNAFTWTGILGS